MFAAGIIYGSSTGSTEKTARDIAGLLQGIFHTSLFDIADAGRLQLSAFALLLIGTSTWGLGKLQDDWEKWLPALDDQSITGIPAAFFGLGDQDGYPETFCDGMGILCGHFLRKGIRHLGLWDPKGYHFTSSRALLGDRFAGLALDEENQPDMSGSRIDAWLKQVLGEFKLIASGAVC